MWTMTHGWKTLSKGEKLFYKPEVMKVVFFMQIYFLNIAYFELRKKIPISQLLIRPMTTQNQNSMMMIRKTQYHYQQQNLFTNKKFFLCTNHSYCNF